VEKRRNGKGVVVAYRVLWTLDGKQWKKSFSAAALADSFRSELMAAARKGEAFDLDSGLPTSWSRLQATTWYVLTLRYTDAKWSYASPNHRRGIAEALTDATETLLLRDCAFPREDLRAALRWSYSMRLRDRIDEPPTELANAVRWLASNTYRMDAFSHRGTAAGLARSVLSRISQTKDGRLAAPNTANRKRMVLHNIFEFACEIGVLDENPLNLVRWTKPRTLATVDPSTVINPQQARRFLTAVEAHGERGKRLKAFFACMYYAALRPEEVADPRRFNLTHLPEQPGCWGEIRLTNSVPRSGSRWTEREATGAGPPQTPGAR